MTRIEGQDHTRIHWVFTRILKEAKHRGTWVAQASDCFLFLKQKNITLRFSGLSLQQPE